MENSVEKTAAILRKAYGKSVLTKTETAAELGISISTMTKRMSDGIDIPDYIKSGKERSATVTFPIRAVAEYLERTVKVL